MRATTNSLKLRQVGKHKAVALLVVLVPLALVRKDDASTCECVELEIAERDTATNSTPSSALALAVAEVLPDAGCRYD